MLFFDEERPRTRIGKIEWEAIKKIHKNKCILCGKTDKQVGGLVKAHLKAHSRGGSHVIPMCSNCHKKFDSGQLGATQIRKLGLTTQQYKRLIPKKKRSTDYWW